MAISIPVLSNLFFPFVSEAVAVQKDYFQTTAVISNTSLPNSPAAFQCWRRPVPLSPYPTIGTFVPLANLTNATLVTLPPDGREGLHKPPHPMLFVLLKGSSTVTLPAEPANPGLNIGAGDVIVAVDTVGEGHWTRYGGAEESVAMQLFFDGGWEDAWEVMHDGVCEGQRADDVQRRRSQIVLG